MNDLSLLASGPDPVLAPASDIRRRGEQRTHRGRVLVAGAAALVVLAGAGTAVALAGAGKPDALVPADPTPSATRDLRTTYGLLGMTAAALLDRGDVSEATGTAWRQGAGTGGPTLMICGDGGPAAIEPVTSLSTSFHTADAPAFVGSSVRHYDTIEHAEASYATVAADLARCPQRPDDSEDGKAFSTFTSLSLRGATGLVQTYRDCVGCDASVTYWGVVTEGTWVAEIATSREADLEPLVEKQRQRLAACTTAEKCRTEAPGEDFPVPADPHEGDRLWADYLLIEPFPEQPALDEVHQLAQELGYAAVDNVLGCDEGAPLEQRPTSTATVVLYFESETSAHAFARTWVLATGRLAITPVEVTVRCLGG